MNTTELADAIAAANDLPKSKAKDIVNSVFASIIEAAKRGDEVAISGFGRFSLKERPAGETLNIPASKSIGFKMSKPVGAAL